MKVARSLALVAVIGLVSYALVAADGDTHQKPKGLYGTITKIADKTITIQTMAKEEADRKTVEVAVDDKTAVTVDKAEAKLADLKTGMRCFITPDTASDKVPATKIAAWKPKEAAAK